METNEESIYDTEERFADQPEPSPEENPQKPNLMNPSIDDETLEILLADRFATGG